ncbi:MAG: aspartate aminotransferase family protein [Alphaproteobacteria bacterium]|nr:aspartate aminotransferase family protein [Alphaproteobacteria bacterium]
MLRIWSDRFIGNPCAAGRPALCRLPSSGYRANPSPWHPCPEDRGGGIALSHVFYRTERNRPIRAASADGATIADASGKRYIDASGGAAVACLGHNHPRVIAAIERQLRTLDYVHSTFFTHSPAEELADWLIRLVPKRGTPDDLDRAYFCSGGSEAVEAALKMARQYFVEIGQPQRRTVVSRRQSYHGNTLGALSAGGNMARRALYEPLLFDVAHAPPCYAYRDKRADETDEAYGARVADAVEAEILARPPGTVMAFIAEPIVGATLGAVPPVPGYFKRVREICDRHGVLMILDEIMCGMGRTGSTFVFEEEGVAPDLVVVAKGLGGGFQPVGAVLATRRIYAAIQDGSGALKHGHTYEAHPVACAGALEVQKVIAEEDLLARVRRLGATLSDALVDRLGNHRHVGDIRGRGLFLGVEIVADRGSKAPFDPGLAVHDRIRRHAMESGLIIYPMGGTIDGKRGDHFIVSPPFTLDESLVGVIVDGVASAVDRAIAELPREAARAVGH